MHHVLPIHLETEDVFLFNLTGRQCILLGTGLALGSISINTLGNAPSFFALVMSLIWTCCFLLLTCALAFVRLAGRGLEEWAMVWLFYQLQPRRFLWAFQPSEFSGNAHEEDLPLARESPDEEERW